MKQLIICLKVMTKKLAHSRILKVFCEGQLVNVFKQSSRFFKKSCLGIYLSEKNEEAQTSLIIIIIKTEWNILTSETHLLCHTRQFVFLHIPPIFTYIQSPTYAFFSKRCKCRCTALPVKNNKLGFVFSCFHLELGNQDNQYQKTSLICSIMMITLGSIQGSSCQYKKQHLI